MTSDFDRTRALFAPLIKRPPLTDQLLQRPPFKFLHDIVVETVKSTGFLHGAFSTDELDAAKASGSRDSKVAFLQKLIDVLNVDGALDGVKPAKIVAGKEPDLTNLMLQRLAEEAAASVPATSKSGGGGGQGKDQKGAASKAVKTKEKGLGGEGKTKSKLPSKTRTPSKERDKTAKVKGEGEKRKKRSASKSRSKAGKENGLASSKETSSSKSKSASTSKKKKSIEPPESPEEAQLEKKHSLTTTDEGISSPQNNRNRVIASPQPLTPSTRPESRTPPRESSGATSKGGDDSGIAEGVESGRHSAMEEGHADVAPPPEVLTLTRPMTASAARPQTAMGRPGTAMARPAPPPRQLKKTKVGDLDPSTVGPQLPTTVDSATLMLEEAGGLSDDGAGEPFKKAIVDSSEQFLVEVEDEDVETGLALAAIASAGDGANVASLASGDGHGSLVNKIIENARELEKSDLAAAGVDASAGGAGADLTELKRRRLEIELIQRALQKTTQGVQPLTRTLEFIADDFDTTLREIDECRKARAACEKALQDRGTADNAPNEKLFTLSAKLRNLDSEVRDVKERIAAARASELTTLNNRELNDNSGDTPEQHQKVALSGNSQLWSQVIDSLQQSNLFLILKHLINEHREKRETAVGLRPHFSIYRDILFVALDRFNKSVDREQFERQFQQELEHLPPRIVPLLAPQDFPPKPVAIACRRIFMPLDVV